MDDYNKKEEQNHDVQIVLAFQTIKSVSNISKSKDSDIRLTCIGILRMLWRIYFFDKIQNSVFVREAFV